MRAPVRIIFAITFALAGVLFHASVSQAASEPPKQNSDAPDSSTPVVRRIPDTLMFTIDELTDIQSRISTPTEEAENRDSSAVENATLYLSTILYSSPNDWTIWLNGRPITPHQDFGEFKVTDIGPRFVELLVPLSAQGMRPVRLEPNQTFIARSGAVVEGQWKE